MSDDEGFFARWSRRKTQRRAGEALPAEPAREASLTPAATPIAAPIAPPSNAAPLTAAREVDGGPSAANALPLPTLADVATLTPTSDFSRFVAAGVDPSVQHAALKTLFSDPHFNEMDGLDVYIDDYNAPNPIPAAMRRRLEEHAAQQARQMLQPDGDAPTVRADAQIPTAVSPDGAPAPVLPQSAPPQTLATLRPETDEDTALRLQPDDAADAAGAGAHRPGPRA